MLTEELFIERIEELQADIFRMIKEGCRDSEIQSVKNILAINKIIYEEFYNAKNFPLHRRQNIKMDKRQGQKEWSECVDVCGLCDQEDNDRE